MRRFINGDWSDASDGATQDLINPSDGTAIRRDAMTTAEDINRAMIAAQKGFKTWKSVSA